MDTGSDETPTAPGTAASEPRALPRDLARARPVILKYFSFWGGKTVEKVLNGQVP